MKILHTYQLASGHVVNLDKSEASFSQNVLTHDKQITREMMRVKAVKVPWFSCSFWEIKEGYLFFCHGLHLEEA